MHSRPREKSSRVIFFFCFNLKKVYDILIKGTAALLTVLFAIKVTSRREIRTDFSYGKIPVAFIIEEETLFRSKGGVSALTDFPGREL